MHLPRERLSTADEVGYIEPAQGGWERDELC